MRAFDHLTAASVGEALAALDASQPAGISLIAGGTDLLPLMKAGLAAPTRLIDLKPARELRAITINPDGSAQIGALVTLAELARDTTLAELAPTLRQAVELAATPQLRAMATIGGNLLQQARCWYYRDGHTCWLAGGSDCFAREGRHEQHAIFDQSPCLAPHPSDLAPALLALDARVVIQAQTSERTVAVGAFLAAPTAERRALHTLAAGEIITALQLPAQPTGSRGVYLKVMERQTWSFALASVAVQLAVTDGKVAHARIVLGGVANTPLSATAAEALLVNQPFTAILAQRAAQAALDGATPLALNRYKVPLARELVRRALMQAVAE